MSPRTYASRPKAWRGISVLYRNTRAAVEPLGDFSGVCHEGGRMIDPGEEVTSLLFSRLNVINQRVLGGRLKALHRRSDEIHSQTAGLSAKRHAKDYLVRRSRWGQQQQLGLRTISCTVLVSFECMYSCTCRRDICWPRVSSSRRHVLTMSFYPRQYLFETVYTSTSTRTCARACSLGGGSPRQNG